MTPFPAPTDRPWSDRSLDPVQRVEALLAVMTIEEKLGQLGSFWDQHGAQEQSEPADSEQTESRQADIVAPGQDIFATPHWVPAAANGLGHITRAFGTRPVEPAVGMAGLAAMQRHLVEETRLGLPAIAHEECLSGLTALRATVYPAPIAWAAAFDADATYRMARRIGADMRGLGVHSGLAPVLDVVRDYRWGRVEETLGEDPYLVSLLGTAYVRGLEEAGVVATLKHFAGYSASRSGRNHGPVSMGRRELLEVILPPFEMAVRDGGARSVMQSYSDVDGVPAAADRWLLTEILRENWDFRGTVVSDYWGVAFLQLTQRIAATHADAGALALTAGVDVELPNGLCYGAGLAAQVTDGKFDVTLVDRAVRRVLEQKLQLGLLDGGWNPDTPAVAGGPDLDPGINREIACELAEKSIILLANQNGALPLDPGLRRIAVVGPNAHDPAAFFGCYSFANHVLPDYPELGYGIEVSSFLDALRAELPGAEVAHERGVPVTGPDTSGIPAAVRVAHEAELCVLVVGDRAGLFGRGTSGEGCDAEDLALPGAQHDLVEAVLATGTPVVLVALTGRPYALGLYADRCAAVVQSFMPGEEGGPALAGVLSGRVNPSGRLPVQIPSVIGGSQPSTYLQPLLGSDKFFMSNLNRPPAFPFGHGLAYTDFEVAEVTCAASSAPTDGAVEVSAVVTNTGTRAGTHVTQLYLADPVAQVTRPLQQLVGFARIPLQPGESRQVTFTIHADRTAFVGRDLLRVVEPGTVELSVGSSVADLHGTVALELTGPQRIVGHDRVMVTPVEVSALTTSRAE